MGCFQQSQELCLNFTIFMLTWAQHSPQYYLVAISDFVIIVFPFQPQPTQWLYFNIYQVTTFL